MSTVLESPRRLSRKACEGKKPNTELAIYLRDNRWDNIFSRIKLLYFLQVAEYVSIVAWFLYSLSKHRLGYHLLKISFSSGTFPEFYLGGQYITVIQLFNIIH